MEESLHFEQISWTPDGSRLVFETLREPSIWSVQLDGTDLRPIADGHKVQVLPAP
jgi:Tol biopolymer transport system component